MLSDGSQVAAAIMAAEASRQKQALKPPSAMQTGQDITGDILTYYRYFLGEIEKIGPTHPG